MFGEHHTPTFLCLLLFNLSQTIYAIMLSFQKSIVSIMHFLNSGYSFKIYEICNVSPMLVEKVSIAEGCVTMVTSEVMALASWRVPTVLFCRELWRIQRASYYSKCG